MDYFPGTRRKDIEKRPPGISTGKCLVCHKTLFAGLSGYQAKHICPKMCEAGRIGAETRLDNAGTLKMIPFFGTRLQRGFAMINAAHVVMVLCLLLLTGCSTRAVHIHPIEGTDIQAVEKGETITAPKDGFFLSVKYIEHVMQAKVK